MAIDIRATVTCSLGTLISGSISDDYLQGSGLVKTRGTCQISGLITPAAGTIVTFSYTKGGVTRNIPRKLRVLSSFADPFRRTTQVELGCKLSYLNDYRPAPTVDGEPSVETGKRQQCLNGYIDFSASSEYGIPISAAGLLTTCCDRLEITAASNPLTNKFFRDSFDFSPGYVSVINDLLVSESYFGYLDTSEVLQIVSLDQDGGSGPVFTSADIIDLSSIGTGPLPGDAVVVRYDSLNLKEDQENEDVQILEQRNWTKDEVIGSVQTVTVRYTAADSNVYEPVFNYIPYTQIITEYGEDDSWNDTTCVIVDTNGEGADLSNTVIKRITTQRVIKAAAAPDYCAQLFAAGIQAGGSQEGDLETIETYEYDSSGQITRQITETYEPYFMWLGRMNLQFVYDDGYIAATSSPVLVRKVVQDTTTLYADLPVFISLDPGETYKRVVNGQKVITSVYENWVLGQQGQQGVAGANQNAAFTSTANCVAYLNSLEQNFNLVDTKVEISRDRILQGIEKRPPVELRMGLNGANFRGEYKAELLYTSGSPIGKRIIELSMPLQSDDYYSSTGSIVKGDAAAKANRYGRVQNRLLLGNRSGVNLQLAPERLPVAPFSPLYLQADGLTALYRSNGNQWAFDSNGIVCSTDALFWAAVGGTGTFWFPVAPGITTLPPEPPIVDGAMNASTVVLPYNETAVYDARVSLGNVVTKLDYSLSLLTVVPALVLRTQVEVRRILKVEVPAASNSVAALVPKVSGGGSVKPPLASMTLTALVPAVAGGSSIKAPLSSVEVAGLDPEQAGKFKLQIFVPSAEITDTAATPLVSGGASIASPVKSVTVQGLTPKLLDANAAAYIAAVEAADGQDLEEATYYAINDFVLGCKTDGIWSAIKACCILAGARTLTGALTPLVGAAPSNVNFVSGDYNRKTGLIGDGNTKYINTNRNRQDDPQDSHHIATWLTAVPTNSTVNWIFGAGSGGGQVGATHLAANSSVFVLRHSSNAAASATGSDNSLSTGLVGLNRSASASFTYYRNGQSVSKTVTSDGRVNSILSIYTTGAFNNSTELSDQRAAFYSIGESLDLSLLSARVSQLLTDLTTAIP